MQLLTIIVHDWVRAFTTVHGWIRATGFWKQHKLFWRRALFWLWQRRRGRKLSPSAQRVLVFAVQVLMEQYVLAATAAPNAIRRTTDEFSIYLRWYDQWIRIIGIKIAIPTPIPYFFHRHFPIPIPLNLFCKNFAPTPRNQLRFQFQNIYLRHLCFLLGNVYFQ